MARMKREAIGCRRGRVLGCASAVVMWFLAEGLLDAAIFLRRLLEVGADHHDIHAVAAVDRHLMEGQVAALVLTEGAGQAAAPLG